MNHVTIALLKSFTSRSGSVLTLYKLRLARGLKRKSFRPSPSVFDTASAWGNCIDPVRLLICEYLLTYTVLIMSGPTRPRPERHGTDPLNAVFKALNDPSRRLLLDRLRESDGQTLAELCAHLPSMTRYGVMNHLRVLAEAELVTSVASGRSKHHYINPVPIRLIHDRWISNFTEPLVGGLAALGPALAAGNKQKEQAVPVPTHRYQTFVRCNPDQAWTALTDGESTVRYFYGTRVESTWSPGDPLRYLGPDGTVVADGEVITSDAPHRLEMTFHPRWDPVIEAEGAAHMAWLVEEVNGLTRITVEYYDLAPDSKQASEFMEGIPLIVAGLKTLLETGQPLALGSQQ